MTTPSQMSWIVTRTLGLLLIVYALAQLPVLFASASLAVQFRKHTAIVVRSDSPVPEHMQDNPMNRQLMKVRLDALTKTGVFLVAFLLAGGAGLYCLKRGKIVHDLLMPPDETGKENTGHKGHVSTSDN